MGDTTKQLKTIVSFEDDKASAHYLQSVANMMGYKLINFDSPLRGIEYLKNNPPDLVLMDIQLPEISGYDATRIIKSLYPDLPVIIQTAYAMKADKERSFEAGCNDYLSKPLSFTEFKLKLKKYLG